MQTLPKDKKIILFDGICNLCDTSVQYIIRHDTKDVFRFVALQSELGGKILDYLNVDRTKTDSIILYEPGIAYYIKAGAAIRIATTLGGWISALGLLRILPKSLQDSLYDFVARNRYKWFGNKESCMVPSPEISAKFL